MSRFPLAVIFFSTAVLLSFPAPALAATPPTPPVSGWLFDDGSGTTAADAWGSAHGTLEGGMGSANWDSGTPFSYSGNRCLTFDGLNDRVLMSLGAIISGRDNSTVSAWFHWTDTPLRKQYSIYSERDECEFNIFNLGVEDRPAIPNGVTFSIFDRDAPPSSCGSGIWNVASDLGGHPTTGVWHHAVAILKNDDELRVFVDRQLVVSVTGVDSYAGPSGSTTVGHTHTLAYDGYFSGKLDEIAVWNTALSDSEAVWLFDHSLQELMAVAAPGAGHAGSGAGPRLSVSPVPYRGGALRIVLDGRLAGEGEALRLVLSDVQGRFVRELAAGAGPERRTLSWDGNDASGRPVPTGVYFLRTTEGASRHGAKVVVVR